MLQFHATDMLSIDLDARISFDLATGRVTDQYLIGAGLVW